MDCTDYTDCITWSAYGKNDFLIPKKLSTVQTDLYHAGYLSMEIVNIKIC